MLLLLFSLAVTALASSERVLYLVDCSVTPHSMLDVGTTGVMCEFNIRTDILANPLESVVVAIGNSDQSEMLPHYAATLTAYGSQADIVEYNNGVSSRVQALARRDGVANLVVVFPYSHCTVTGTMLALRVIIGTERSSVFYRQPNSCARANVVKRQALDTGDAMSGATSGTFTFLIVFVLFACIILCVSALFL